MAEEYHDMWQAAEARAVRLANQLEAIRVLAKLEEDSKVEDTACLASDVLDVIEGEPYQNAGSHG